MHIIQRHILKKLTLGKNVRYKDLKPKEVEGNQFMYHLGVVIEKGYVKKNGVFYNLTTAGKMYADRVELESFIPREQPKIVTMIYCENNKKQILFFRRIRSPLFNLVHIPYGKIHMGELVHNAAQRELQEKTGLSAKLSHIGEIYVRVYEDEELIAHILHHIFYGKEPKGTIPKNPAIGIGKIFWAYLKDVPEEERIAGLNEIVKIIQKNKGRYFFEEFDLRLPKNNPQT